MDFWDLTKLLFRRWYVAVPMLVLSAVAALWTASNVKPDYIATAYVQLVPPVLPPTSPGASPTRPDNPWLDLGIATIGNAAIITVQDQTVIEELEATGYSGSFTVSMSQQSPLIQFEIVGKSESQARATAEQLASRFDQSVADLQKAYGVSPTESITTRRLDLGTNIKQSDSKVKRALVAIAGTGVLLTAALTIGLDALLRTRARRRRKLGEPEVTAATAPSRVGERPAPTSNPGVSSGPGDSAASDEELSSERTTFIAARPPGKPKANGNSARRARGVTVEYQPVKVAKSEPDAPAQRAVTGGEPSTITEISPDATIVLPLALHANEQWAARDGEGKTRR